MNEWERDLQKIFKGEPNVPHRYELRPGEKGPIIYCSTCSAIFEKECTQYLDEIVADAMKHEKTTHSRRPSETNQ